MQRHINQARTKHDWQLIDHIRLTSMLNLHPDVNKQNETLAAKVIRCKQKTEFDLKIKLSSGQPAITGSQVLLTVNQKHKRGCCLKAAFQILHKWASPIGREGQLQEPHMVPVGGELRVINVPPRKNHDTAATHKSNSLSSKVMIHSCSGALFSAIDVLIEEI